MSDPNTEDSMTLDDYQRQAMTTAVYPGRGTLTGLTYTVSLLASESGEVSGAFSRALRDDASAITFELATMRREQLIAEGGDCLWSLAALASELRIPLSELARLNLEKLASRQHRGTIQGAGDNR